MNKNEYTDKEYAEQEKKDMHYTRHYLPSEVRLKKGKDQPNPAETTYFETHMRLLYKKMYADVHTRAEKNNLRVQYTRDKKYKRESEGKIVEFQNGHGLEELVICEAMGKVLLCINKEGILYELRDGALKDITSLIKYKGRRKAHEILSH